MKTVQIPTELFFKLIQFHILEQYEDEDVIQKALMDKMDAMVMRDLYSKYKTAPTEEEKEKARKKYLDRRGVPQSFRW